MDKIPSLFVGHGSPMNAIQPDNTINQGFATVVKRFPRPRLILCISAHWYSNRLEIGSGAEPEMMYDFSGFPAELSEVVYPAKGDPAFAERLSQILLPDVAVLNPSRGFDHGAWAVLRYLYPEADIPVVQMSIDRTKPIEWHYDLALRLRSLREEGVLILGSGNIVHNLGAISWEHVDTLGAGYDWAFSFRDSINRAIMQDDVATLLDPMKLGEPAHLSIPTPDHYLPLLYVMAQREQEDELTFFNDVLVGGSISMTSVLVGA